MAKILIADDDQTLAESVKDWLEADRHEVELAHDGAAALDFLRSLSFDVVILDWNMPNVAGIEVCKRYRASGGNACVLMLTGMDQTRDKTAGLNAGADDYLTKPFDIEELSARVSALLRRSRDYIGTKLTAGPVEIDTASRVVVASGEEVHLKPTEFALLEYFMRHPKQVVSAESLLKNVWRNDADASIDAVYTCVTRLRKKIKDEGKNGLIRNVHGVGYQFSPPD